MYYHYTDNGPVHTLPTVYLDARAVILLEVGDCEIDAYGRPSMGCILKFS